MKIDAPIEVEVSLGPDGQIVVNVDTTEDTEQVRVLLNDATLYVGDPDEQENPAHLLTLIDVALQETSKPDYAGIALAGRVDRILRKRITLEEYR